jgi:predicted flap endonuclease-1-like 5' DNA nuclease
LIQDLTARSTTEQMRAVQRLRESLQRISRGELNQRVVREEYMRFTREETSRYLHALIRLGLKFHDEVLELIGTYNNQFFEQVLGATTSGSAASTPPGAPPGRINMELRAPVGQEATGSFVVENKRTETVEITFLVSEFVGAANTVPFRPPLQLQPPSFTLGPNEHRVVTLRLPLLVDLFAPEQRYATTIVVHGYDDLVLDLSVWTEAPPDAEGVSFRPDTPKAEAGESTTASGPYARRHSAIVDDMTRLQGIGTKYAEKLREADITTFADLATVDDQALVQILGTSALGRAKRDEWRAQASLAAAGEEERLRNLQERLISRNVSQGTTNDG